jgi:hypothetical protein
VQQKDALLLQEWFAIDTVVAGATTADEGGSSSGGGATTTARSGFANKFNWHTFQFVVVETINGTSLKLTDADLSQFKGQRIR